MLSNAVQGRGARPGKKHRSYPQPGLRELLRNSSDRHGARPRTCNCHLCSRPTFKFKRPNLSCRTTLAASGKVAALLTALSKTKGQADVYAFVDSDALIQRNWLTELVGPLIDRSIGATTGFRWHFPLGGGFWSHVQAAWNASGTNLLFSTRYNFPWGGATAVRSETLDNIGIEGAWANAISDDMALNSALRQRGYSVILLPQCTVATFTRTDLPHFLEWATRQTTLTRIFNPRVWRYGLVAYAFLDFVFLLGLAGLGLGVTLTPIWFVPSALLLTPAVSGFIRSSQRCSTFGRALPHLKAEFERTCFPHALASCLVPWFMIYSIAKSAMKHEIEWRGRKYELMKMNDTAFP